MQIKDKLLLLILSLAIIPIIAVSIVFYTISIGTLRRQIQEAHYESVSAVDTLISVIVNDMANIAFTSAPKIAHLIEKGEMKELKEKLNTIDQTNIQNIGTGRGLGYQIVIVTDRNGNILGRSNIVEGAEREISQKGHILFLDERKEIRWNYSENFGIAFNNAAQGNLDTRKIIYNEEFLRREGYDHLINKYGFGEMMGLTAFQPILDEKNQEQIGILILITILNNNYNAIGAINVITGAEFTAITPTGRVVASYFINPPTINPDIIKMAEKRAEEIRQKIKEPRGRETIFYTKERILLKACPGIIMFEGDETGNCYYNGKIILPEELIEKPYRFHFIAEVDQDFKYVSIRGIAYELTYFDTLLATQTKYSIITFLITFLIIGTISLIATQRVVSPILNFTKEIQQIKKEGFGKKINIKTGDEIETLANSFNSMSEKLAQNYQELNEQKDILEIRVNAKTKTLKEIAENLDKQVQEKTKVLQDRLEELEKFHKTTIGRELKMIELKKEIAELKEKLEKKEG